MNGQLLSGRYQIIDSLAKGGFAQTYLAEDIQRPNRPQCVVKKLKLHSQDPNFVPTARRLFQQEAEILEKLGTHSQIPQLLAYFEERGEFFLVQEYINGNSFTKEIQEKCWQESEVIQFVEELLNLLVFVHSHNAIHRDIKPDNLIRRKQDGKLVLIDFGAVKEIPKQTVTLIGNSKTTIGIGTIGYMPPEQIIGKPRPCSDIYAVGITAIQALTGLNSQQLNYDDDGEVIWLPHAKVSQGLANFINKTVSYYIKDRYQTAVEALTALQQILPLTKIVYSHSNLLELNVNRTIVPVNTVEINNLAHLNSQEMSIPQTIVPVNTVNNNLRSFSFNSFKKTAWLRMGLTAILASTMTAIVVKSWSVRSTILVESKPSLSPQSTPTTTPESKLSLNTNPPSNSHSSNTSETIAPKANSVRSRDNYDNKQTSSSKVSIKPQEKPTQTTSVSKIEEPKKTVTTTTKTGSKSRTETQKKTTPTTNKTVSKSQPTTTKDRTEAKKKTTPKSNKTRAKSQTNTRNNRDRGKVTARNNRSQGRGKTTKRKDKVENRRKEKND